MSTAATAQIGALRLGPGRPAVIVPLTGADRTSLLRQAQSLGSSPAAAGIDLVEWRVDLLSDLPGDEADLRDLVAALRERLGPRPLLATVRTRAEGGQADLEGTAYRDLITALVRTGSVDAVDVEHRRSTAREAVRSAQQRGLTVVASHHDFHRTPSAPQILDHLRAMERTGAEVVKIAVTPRDAQDVLTLLAATLTASADLSRPIISMSMGPLGASSRLSGGVFGSVATFASLGEASAPGQLPLETVLSVLDSVHGPR